MMDRISGAISVSYHSIINTKVMKIKRIYEQPADNDGYRILVDHLWPRGISKESAHIDEWDKKIAPSTGLRKWFNHEPEKFEEFKRRYSSELDEMRPELKRLLDLELQGGLTLLYSAKDTQHNQAAVLLEYLKTMKNE
jgi:uncharacterized protein YeaO (DUF488 family)